MRRRLSLARKMARHLLRKHRVAEAPVPVEWMLFEEGVRVVRLEYADDTRGESWWEEDRPCIGVAASACGAPLRFTLAHEWGHLALRHHDRRTSDPGAGRVWDAARAAASREAEANVFAAELLMPEALFLRDVGRGLGAPALARRYQVSLEAARRRLAEFAA